MVLPYAIELVVQQDHDRERLLHVHWRVCVAYIDNAIGIGNRSIEAELHPMEHSIITTTVLINRIGRG